MTRYQPIVIVLFLLAGCGFTSQGDAIFSRPAAVGRMIYEPTLAVDNASNNDFVS